MNWPGCSSLFCGDLALPELFDRLFKLLRLSGTWPKFKFQGGDISELWSLARKGSQPCVAMERHPRDHVAKRADFMTAK